MSRFTTEWFDLQRIAGAGEVRIVSPCLFRECNRSCFPSPGSKVSGHVHRLRQCGCRRHRGSLRCRHDAAPSPWCETHRGNRADHLCWCHTQDGERRRRRDRNPSNWPALTVHPQNRIGRPAASSTAVMPRDLKIGNLFDDAEIGAAMGGSNAGGWMTSKASDMHFVDDRVPEERD